MKSIRRASQSYYIRRARRKKRLICLWKTVGFLNTIFKDLQPMLNMDWFFIR